MGHKSSKASPAAIPDGAHHTVLAGEEHEVVEATSLLAESVREFGGSLALELSKGDSQDSLFLSPYGISVCLALVLMGARKGTLGQMLLALHIDPTKAIAGKQHPGAQPCEDGPVSAAWLRDQLAPTYGSLAAAVLRDAERSGTKLQQANAAVINASHPLLAGGAFDDPNHPVRRYAELIRERMGAKLIEARDAKQAEREVDAFASASTQGLIKEMGLELDNDTLLVLLNAIYFKANFASKFDKALTQPADFTALPGGAVSSVQMMHKNAKMLYAENEALQAVRLEYAGEQAPFSLIIALPRDASAAGLQDAIGRLKGPDGLRNIRFRSRKGELFLPRFKFEARRVLNDALAAMGMGDAFVEGRADLSGIAPAAFLSEVVHKAVVEVNEEGTEAAAVTAAVVMERCAVMREDPPFEMRCNRPFVFAIEHGPTGLPLFTGVVKKL